MPKADRNTTELPAAEGGHVRFDKWLWAARFYRTRSLAALAIVAGQARHAGERVKVAHPIRVGDTITIRKQGIVWEVVVTGLSPRAAGPPQGTNRSASGGSAAAKAASVGAHIRRGGAAEAATLYRETAASAKTR
ncbi:MAG TPA: S4 domain-containing protein, partial [Casimicrobiaceae bacterium]